MKSRDKDRVITEISVMTKVSHRNIIQYTTAFANEVRIRRRLLILMEKWG